MKRLIAGTLAGIALGAGGAQLAPNEITIQDLAAQEATAKTQIGKYRYEKGENYEVHEYVTPDGTPGYQIFYSDDVATYSVGFGPEAKDRTFTILKVASST